MQETPFDVEIIVADDCSTDATSEIITSLLSMSTFTSKVLVDDKNLGMRMNYQRGFAACSGKYIALMEGDDYWSDQRRLVKHIEYLDTHPEYVMTFNRLTVFNEEKGTYRLQEWNHNLSQETITTAMLAKQNIIGNLSACVIRRSAFMKLNPDIHELGFADWMLGMALGEHGTMVKFSEPMSVYRVHAKGKWSGNETKDNFLKMINYTIDKYDKYLGYRYHNEFMAHKIRLKSKLKKISYTQILDKYIPDFIIHVLKLLIPAKIRKSFWQRL